MHSKKKRHRVIIVGAGSAGLAAGSLLIDSGFDVKILEASNKICGRVRKLEGFAEFPIELGGEELHGSNNVYKDCILMAGGYLVPEEAYNMYIEYKGDVIPDHRLSVLAARDYGFFEKLLLD
jgi:monoamine oxidase